MTHSRKKMALDPTNTTQQHTDTCCVFNVFSPKKKPKEKERLISISSSGELRFILIEEEQRNQNSEKKCVLV